MRAFYGSRISEHMIQTPEGYLICKDVPIARTGTQDYRGMEFGAPKSEQIYHVKRPEAEVFNSAALASFEGKPVVDEHPKEDVKAQNVLQHIKGVCQNVHRGTGEFSDCMVADLLIYDKGLIEEIKGGKRDISCGYDCLWVQDGEASYIHREIRGNHVAVVGQGRAGHKVSIRDARPKGGNKRMSLKETFSKMITAFARDSETTPEDMQEALKLSPDNKVSEPETRKQPAQDEMDGNGSLEERMNRLEQAVQSLSSMIRNQGKNAQSPTSAPAAEDEDLTPEEDETGEGASTPTPEPAAQEKDALDALEEELKGKKPIPSEAENADDEDTVKVSPEVINNSQREPEAKDESLEKRAEPDVIPDNEDKQQAHKAAMDAIDAARPWIANLPPKQRKRAADSLAALIRGTVVDSGYGTLIDARRNGHQNATQDMGLDDRALGKAIRDKWNPHYKH